jgi:hypothetical protein
MGKAGNTPYLGGEKNKAKFLKIELNFLMQADRPETVYPRTLRLCSGQVSRITRILFLTQGRAEGYSVVLNG